MSTSITNAFLLSTLALGLSACGGDKEGVKTNHPTESNIKAFTIPFWSEFPMTVSKHYSGKDLLTVERQPEESYLPPNAFANQPSKDARQATITHIYQGFLDNNFGMLCNLVGEAPVGPQPAKKEGEKEPRYKGEHLAKYVYVSKQLVEVDFQEIFGRIYQSNSNCRNSPEFWGIDAKGNGYSFKEKSEISSPSVPLFDQPLPHDPKLDINVKELEKIFSQEGMEQIIEGEPRIFRAKAYKYTANGKTTYVFFAMDKAKNPVSGDFPQHTTVSISR